MSILSGIGAAITRSLPPIEPPATARSQDGGDLKVGTYNLAAGNKDHKANAPETTAHLADQVVNHGLDVVALQEVDVNTTDAAKHLPDGITDYNEYVLAQVSAEEAGLQEPITYERTEADDGTVTITGSDEDQRSSKVTITPEYYTETGEPAEAGDPEAVVTVYNAQVQSPDGVKDYTVVYGSSLEHDDGTYGNAVLMGPDAPLARDADGNALVARHDLGANDPKKTDAHPNGENRTALEVNIQVDGETATVFSTHFTATNEFKGDVTRFVQHDTLTQLAEDAGGNTIILGDFNTSDYDHFGHLSGKDNDPDSIDRIYVSNDIDTSDRDTVTGGGSDHDLITWNIDLDA